MFELCHHDPSVVFDIDGIEYFGAERATVQHFDGDLVFNLGQEITASLLCANELKRHLEPGYEEIYIPWPDMGCPKVKLSMWRAIHEYCKSRKYTRVCFYCHHGHGRTGTALSSLLVANKGLSAIEAVDVVRSYHCSLSVETGNQCIYISEVDAYYNQQEYKVPKPSVYME